MNDLMDLLDECKPALEKVIVVVSALGLVAIFTDLKYGWLGWFQ